MDRNEDPSLPLPSLSHTFPAPPSFAVYIKIFWANQSSRTPAQQRRISSQLCAVMAQHTAVFLTLCFPLFSFMEETTPNCWNQNNRLLRITSAKTENLVIIYSPSCLSKLTFFHRTLKEIFWRPGWLRFTLVENWIRESWIHFIQKHHKSNDLKV